MTLVLALDTATAFATVALGEPGNVQGEVMIAGRRQAATLVPAVMDLLRYTGRRLQDVRGLVVADGPGGFTGLRIGFATAQGLLREHPSMEMRRAPSLMGASWIGARYADGPVAAVYDALRGEVFAAAYGFGDGGVQVLLPPRLTTVTALCRDGVEARLAVGDGAVLYPGEVAAWTGRPPLGPPWGGPRASALLELLAVPGACTRIDAPFEAEPDYGRSAAAQTKWEAHHGAPLQDPGSRPR